MRPLSARLGAGNADIPPHRSEVRHRDPADARDAAGDGRGGGRRRRLNEDPTVLRLQERTADLLGKEAALFVPSGTMANQIAVGVHARPGDELLCDPTAHVYVWEGGGIARLWGVTPRTIEPAQRAARAWPTSGARSGPTTRHYARTRLVCLENTHNRGGGRVHPITAIAEIAGWARAHGLAMHLDGARLMNAVVASGIAAAEWARYFDTVSICFSKGLGAPVGSALAGSADAIHEAHRLRKVLGGGMRQAGIIAAGALHALEHHVDRLAEDHANAQILARAVEETAGLALESGPVETNLVWIAVDPALGTARDVAARLRAEGVLVSALGPQVLRACTHLDVSREDAERAAEAIRRVGRDRRPESRPLGGPPMPIPTPLGPRPRRGPGPPGRAGRRGRHVLAARPLADPGGGRRLVRPGERVALRRRGGRRGRDVRGGRAGRRWRPRRSSLMSRACSRSARPRRCSRRSTASRPGPTWSSATARGSPTPGGWGSPATSASGSTCRPSAAPRAASAASSTSPAPTGATGARWSTRARSSARCSGPGPGSPRCSSRPATAATWKGRSAGPGHDPASTACRSRPGWPTNTSTRSVAPQMAGRRHRRAGRAGIPARAGRARRERPVALAQ